MDDMTSPARSRALNQLQPILYATYPEFIKFLRFIDNNNNNHNNNNNSL